MRSPGQSLPPRQLLTSGFTEGMPWILESWDDVDAGLMIGLRHRDAGWGEYTPVRLRAPDRAMVYEITELEPRGNPAEGVTFVYGAAAPEISSVQLEAGDTTTTAMTVSVAGTSFRGFALAAPAGADGVLRGLRGDHSEAYRIPIHDVRAKMQSELRRVHDDAGLIELGAGEVGEIQWLLLGAHEANRVRFRILITPSDRAGGGVTDDGLAPDLLRICHELRTPALHLVVGKVDRRVGSLTGRTKGGEAVSATPVVWEAMPYDLFVIAAESEHIAEVAAHAPSGELAGRVQTMSPPGA
jgi:hypothetical protein